MQLLTSCGSIFYYPIQEELVYRKKMTLQPEDIYFASEDGTPLHGWYFSKTKDPKAVILYFHGNAQNLSTHFFTLYHAPDNGYDYFIFDYRGYGKSQGYPTPEGTIRDGRAALRWVKARWPNKPIVVFAQSLGGAIGLRTVLDMQDEIPIDMMIVDSTFASYRSEARSIMSRSWLLWLFQPLGWLMVDNSQAVRSDLHKLKAPLLVIHGDADVVVDFSLGQDVFERAPEPKEFWHIPGGHHTDFMWQQNGKYSDLFFDRLDAKFAQATPPKKARSK